MIDRVLGMNNLQVELSVLGSMLYKEDYFYYCISRLKEDDFYKSDHQKLFRVLKERFEKGKRFEELIWEFPGEIEDKKEAGRIEATASYAIEFALDSDGVFKSVVERLIELSKKRREVEIAGKLARGEITREEALALLSDLERDRKLRGGSVSDIAIKWLKKQEEQLKNATLQGISTGSAEIDKIFTYRKELSLICARPSIGKTMTALALLYSQAKLGIKVQFFSLELTEDEVMARLISIHTGEPLYKIVYGWLEFGKLVEAADEIRNLPIYIEPGPLTFPQIKAKIYEIKPDIVYIDYIQKVLEHSNEFRNRKVFLDYVSSELLEIAKVECPVVALAQLNRGTRTGKDEPTIEHIKETGNFEQDASNILLLHRNLKETPDKLQIKVAKCRVSSANKEIVVDFINGIPQFKSPAMVTTIPEQQEFEYEGIEDIDF
jgi:replicative DNA helicase